MLTNQNYMRESKSRLYLANTCNSSWQNVYPSRCTPKIWKLKCRELQFCLFFYMGVRICLLN